MNQQHDSLLFRIPRELRDEIYHYHVDEDDGYHHDSATGKLRLANGDSADLSLQYTCKRVAAEMDGLALEVNTITFRTMLDVPGTTDHISNADLFHYYIEYGRSRLLQRMLEWSHTLVTPEVMRSLCERYPQNIAVKRMADAQAKEGNRSLQTGRLWDETDGVDTADYNEIGIQEDEPWIAENEERFEKTLQNHDTRYISRKHQQHVLDWRPDFWWIPSRSFLDKIGKFIPADDYWHPCGPERRANLNKPDSHFSAAAVAIQFFERLGTKRCSHLRNVVIQEDEYSKADPATHARGLIPLCVANKKLRIERRLDIWRTTIIRANDRQINHDGAHYIVEYIEIWLSETKILHGLGMPTDSFVLTLHGPTHEASQQICDAVIRAAIWDEGCTTLSLMPAHYHGMRYFEYSLGEGLFDLVKDVIRGDIPARFGKRLPRKTHDPVDWIERMDGWGVLTRE